MQGNDSEVKEGTWIPYDVVTHSILGWFLL